MISTVDTASIAPLNTSRMYQVTSEDTANTVVFALKAAGRYAAMTAGISGWFVETRPAADDVETTDGIVRSVAPSAFVPSGPSALLVQRMGLAAGTAGWSHQSVADRIPTAVRVTEGALAGAL